MTELPLAEEFPLKTRDDWRALVDQALKGADFDKRLVAETYDGIKIDPLYTKGDVDGPAVRPGRIPAGPWRIVQACTLPSPADANKAILEDLEGGTTGVALQIAPTPEGPGVQIWSLQDLERTLRDVHLEAVPVNLSAAGRGLEAAALMIAFADKAGVPNAARTGTLGLDPIGALAGAGTLRASVADHCVMAVEMQGRWAEGSIFSIATQPYHAAGCSEAQELGIALAAGVAHLRGLEAAGMPLDMAAGSLRFALVADTDIFTTIAKFRAWPVLWGRVCTACGLNNVPGGVAAETATRMLTTRDPWVNMLRATAATFAAATGGAESIAVAPYSSALGLPDGFARRMARNTQTILQEESNIARVADAAAGSWYVESLTADLIASAWSVFQSIEAAGGMVAALKAGMVQEMIESVRAKRLGDVAKRKRAITGVSEFPHLSEAPVAIAEAGRPAIRDGTDGRLHLAGAPGRGRQRQRSGLCRRWWRNVRTAAAGTIVRNPSKRCGTPATMRLRRRAKDLACSSPLSGRRPTSPTERPGHATCSKPAASKRSRAAGSKPPTMPAPPLRRAERPSFASAQAMRSMASAQRKPPANSKPPALLVYFLPDGRETGRRRCAKPVSTISPMPARTCWPY